MRDRILIVVVLVAMLALLPAVSADAQTQAGVRAGISAGPDQFFFGGHLESGPLIERVTFRPNVEVGVGDSVTTVAFNLELVYSIPLAGKPWRVYIGGGPAAAVYAFHARRGGDSRVEGGFNILIGAQHDRGLFTELKVGALHSPDLKFTIGYAF